MNNKKQRVVIAGGGTAGWMAAAALTRLLHNRVDVTLIESSDIGTVGVGEATIPTLVFFHQLLKIDEKAFMAATNATFKLGINFENWRTTQDSYLHAFGATGQDCWAAGFQHFWTRGRQLGLSGDFGQYCLERVAAEAHKFAHLPKNGLNYAFHIDAGRYAGFLRQLAEQAGLKRIDARIEKVVTRPADGFITQLQLDNGDRVDGDLFIDCTGFRGVLIEETLHTGYTDWSHWLLCDSAVAVQTESHAPPLPYTRCIAHEEGWQWRIPLQNRTGNGLVFCSKYLSDDAATQRLTGNIEGAALNDPKVIKFRPGRRVKQWNRNCVSLGLASGFIEPLESTSIHLIQQGIVRLLRMFPHGEVQQSVVDEFNRQSVDEIEHIRDFIILHYHVTERTDSAFWRHCKQMDVPDSLARRLTIFRESGQIHRKNNELFDDSWQQVMIGQGLLPEAYHPIADMMSEQELQNFLTHIKTNIDRTVAGLPTHRQYLNSLFNRS